MHLFAKDRSTVRRYSLEIVARRMLATRAISNEVAHRRTQSEAWRQLLNAIGDYFEMTRYSWRSTAIASRCEALRAGG